MKTAVGVGRISPNGTLSIPEAMLMGMAFQKGGDVVMVQGRESIMIKPVRKPDRRAALKRLFAWGDEMRRTHDLKREDIEKTIKEVRRAQSLSCR